MDFELLADRMEAKRLAAFVPLFLFQQLQQPSGLNLSKPAPSTRKLRTAYMLCGLHPSLWRYCLGSTLSYARAKMPRSLCEYATARDLVSELQALQVTSRQQTPV